jgi:AraC-like DNA-binding protein
MLSLNVYSLALAAGAAPALILAALMLRAPRNRLANRFLSALIACIAIYVTPYIIGFAGFYDVYPWLNLAPFDISLAFGPLFYFYALTLTGAPLEKRWMLHFAPVAAQFLSQALVFPLPLAVKNRWDETVNMPFVDPFFTLCAFVSLIAYGRLSWRRYKAYARWIRAEEADAIEVDPSWIRNALLALAGCGVIWAAFWIANLVDPSRNYFDRFWLYFVFSVIAAYLAIEGWRHAWTAFPAMTPPAIVTSEADAAPPAGRDWAKLGAEWSQSIDDQALWRDPNASLSSFARALGVNTTYLSKALNDGLGVSFHDYVNARRIAAMKRLLENPDEKRDLMTLALDVGFRSKASFNRIFRAATGQTPSAWRKARLAAIEGVEDKEGGSVSS